LEGDIEEPVSIEWPEGMVEVGFISLEEFKRLFTELHMGMYGNMGAAIRFYKTYCNHLTKNVR